MATKEQERNALKKIRKIIDELGEESYLGFAFDGCFEIAEQNIDNDWAISPKERLESVLSREEDLRSQIDGLLSDNEELTEMVTELRKQIIPPKVLDTIRAVINNQAHDIEAEMDDEATFIVDHADDPSTTAFRDAVHKHRMLRNTVIEYRSIYTLLSDRIREAFKVK